MAGLKTLLGLYPKTSNYEKQRNKLEEEYNALIEFENSEEFSSYHGLEQFLKSDEFGSVKRELIALKYKDSEECRKETEFKRLKKDKSLKLYQKTLSSEAFAAYEQLKGSNSIAKFDELHKLVNSPEFQRASKSKDFQGSDNYQKLQEYNQLKSDSQIKAYQKFITSKQFQNYNAVIQSDKVKKFEELNDYVKTQDFLDRKQYLSLSPKKRWQESEAFRRQDEFEKLQKSSKFKWYFKTKGHKKFAWFNTWQPTFREEFNNGKLDREKWLTKYYWGEELLQDSYSLVDEKHYITDGNNLELNGGILKIVTRKEKVDGKMWNPEYGFLPQSFDYSSGLINTGKSFRQKYGLFEAKIRVTNTADLLNAFWMVGDQMVPHVDILKAYNTCVMGITTDKGASVLKQLKRSKLSSDFYIFSLEWFPNRMTWRINGVDIASTQSNIPQEEMYIALSAGVYTDDASVPGSMEVDWVKCYQRTDNN